jgi:hypothetical protein
MQQKEIIDIIVNKYALSAYLCGNSGDRLVVYQNCWKLLKPKDVVPVDEPLSMVVCPGWHDVDESFYVDDLVYDCRKEFYCDYEGNFYDVKDLIEIKCLFGDVSKEISSLRVLLYP